MRIKFVTNVGTRDASQYGLDFQKCTRGSVLEIQESIGRKLCSSKLAIEVAEEKLIKAVPDSPAIVAAQKASNQVKPTYKKES